MRLRSPLVLGIILAMVLPSTLANSPLPPWTAEGQLTGAPFAGRTVDLVVTLKAHTRLSEEVILQTPTWVRVEPPGPWVVQAVAGQQLEHRWRLTPSREGYWSAAAKGEASGWCCVYARSDMDAGAWVPRSDQLERLLPPMDAVGWLGCRVIDAGRVEFSYAAVSVGPWPGGLGLRAGMNFREAQESVEPEGRRVVARHVQGLTGDASVAHVVQASATAFATVEGAWPATASRTIPRATHQYVVTRQGDTVYQQRGEPCPVLTDDPPASAFETKGFQVPGPMGPLELGIVALASAGARRLRKAAFGD